MSPDAVSTTHHWRAPKGAQEKGEGIRGNKRERERVQNLDHKMQPNRRQKVHTKKKEIHLFLTHFVFVVDNDPTVD